MNILCTGGGGYVGSLLVPALLARGHDVTVIDWFLYGPTLPEHERLRCVQTDLREIRTIDAEAVIHLACISNDPSFELDPDLGRSVNYDATARLVRMAQQAGVSRFIYASSSSVYGIKPDGVDVTEDLALEPLTEYSKYKALSEDVVRAAQSPYFTTTVLRPATLCGYSPRQRLDLIVNILTTKAVQTKQIPVWGGAQRRPNLHVADMVTAYLKVLDAPIEKVAGQVFNVGAENATVKELAERVQQIAGGKLTVEKSDDTRSYAINSDKFMKALKWKPTHTIEDAIRDLCAAFKDGRIADPNDPKYSNIRQMQLAGVR